MLFDLVVKVKSDIALHGNPISELRDVTCHMGSHSVICHPTQVNAPPAVQAGTRFTYPRGMEGWVNLVDLKAPQPGVEPATFRSRVRRRTAAPPRQPHSMVSITKVTVCQSRFVHGWVTIWISYVTSHPGQLSLVVVATLWVGTLSTSESWGVIRPITWYTSSMSVVWQRNMVYGWGQVKWEINAAWWLV